MSADLSLAQRAMRDGQQLLCLQFGIGGDQWTLERTSGDGVNEDRSPEPPRTIDGYARTKQPAAIMVTAPGVRTGQQDLYFFDFAEPGQDIAAGDVLISLADPALRFTVSAPDLAAGYAKYKLDQSRPTT